VLTIGAANSSNSVRLKEVAERFGADAAYLRLRLRTISTGAGLTA